MLYQVQVRPHQTHPCLYGPRCVHCAVMLLQTVPTCLGAWNCPKYFGVLKHSKFFSVELNSETQPHTIIPPPQMSHLAQFSPKCTVLLMATFKPRLVHESARWKSVIHHSREGVSTALESSSTLHHYISSHACKS